jgi:hypothetical protein
MSNRPRVVLAAIGVLAGAFALGSAWAEEPGHYAGEIQAALSGGKPVLVDFYADW